MIYEIVDSYLFESSKVRPYHMPALGGKGMIWTGEAPDGTWVEVAMNSLRRQLDGSVPVGYYNVLIYEGWTKGGGKETRDRLYLNLNTKDSEVRLANVDESEAKKLYRENLRVFFRLVSMIEHIQMGSKRRALIKKMGFSDIGGLPRLV